MHFDTAKRHKKIDEAQLEMLMNTRAGIVFAGVSALALWVSVVAATAQELSEHAVKSFMDYAWALTPEQFSGPDGTVIVIDKTKRDEVTIPMDIAREVIKAGRLSAHAQICDMPEDQVSNHRAMMRREEAKQKWSKQQLVYISQLHLTTVMLLTGRIKLVEKEGDKEVVIEDKTKAPNPTCTDEQRGKIKELITAYVAASPPPRKIAAVPPAGGAAPAAKAEGPPASTGSTTVEK